MLLRYLMYLILIIGGISFPVELEGSGEESNCTCAELNRFDTESAKAPNEETDQCCNCCCGDHDEIATITTSTTQTPSTSEQSCCCCCEHVDDCGQQVNEVIASNPLHCPSGWISLHKSCYLIVNEKLNLMEARKYCLERRSSLFVADSIEEFNEIMKQTPLYYWSWIGLGQSEANSVPQWGVIESSNPSLRCLPLNENDIPKWGGRRGVEPSMINWLITPFSSTANGWSAISNCVGHYNGGVYSASYAYFYPCSSQFYSICEKNSTLLGV